MSRVMRKPTIRICENKDADQLRGNREADQRLCFRYIDSTVPLLSKSEISSLKPSSVAVQPGLCGTRSETRMLVFSGRGSYIVDMTLLFLNDLCTSCLCTATIYVKFFFPLFVSDILKYMVKHSWSKYNIKHYVEMS